ncbi:MAG: hypothetical protein ACU84H_10510 [Gammaproteobacteria bacterium]
MDKKNRIVLLSGTLLVLVVAVAQWVVLLERASAGVWEWYKFYGYVGGGRITVGLSTQVLFYLLSSVVAFVGLLLSHMSNDDDAISRIRKKFSRLGALSLVIGMIFWTLILISPLVVFR